MESLHASDVSKANFQSKKATESGGSIRMGRASTLPQTHGEKYMPSVCTEAGFDSSLTHARQTEGRLANYLVPVRRREYFSEKPYFWRNLAHRRLRINNLHSRQK